MSKSGRKTAYDPDIHPAWAWSLACTEGLDDAKIAERMNIARSTLNNWKNKHEEFKEALRSGKAPVDSKVERSLLERATGYSFTERRIVSTVNPQTGQPKIERIETYERHIPPDTTAQIYWLKNRRRELWKDKWDIEIDTEKEITFNIVGTSRQPIKEENK